MANTKRSRAVRPRRRVAASEKGGARSDAREPKGRRGVEEREASRRRATDECGPKERTAPAERAPTGRSGSAAEARKPKQRGASAAQGAAAAPTYSVAAVVAQLHLHRQRATYDAVGGLRGALAVRVRGWFAGREAPENSFVVSRISGEPTGYAPERVHPALKERPVVIESTDALRAWLALQPIRDHQDSRSRAERSGL